MLPGVITPRGFWDAGQQRGLPQGEVLGRHAEIGPSRSFDPPQAAAVRDVVEITLQDGLLIEPLFHDESLEGLDQLAPESTGPGVQGAHELLADSRAAGNGAASPGVLPQGTRQGLEIHAEVSEEPAVLRGQGGQDHPGRHVFQGHGLIDCLIEREKRPQGAAVAVRDLHGRPGGGRRGGERAEHQDRDYPIHWTAGCGP